MYILSVEKEDAFAPEEIGKYEELEDAQAKAKEIKIKEPTTMYKIEETNGGFNSYGDLLSSVVEEG